MTSHRSQFDVMCLLGNGYSVQIQMKIDIYENDRLEYIAITKSTLMLSCAFQRNRDELNQTACQAPLVQHCLQAYGLNGLTSNWDHGP